MGNPRDFYEVLNIPKDSPPEHIRRAYKTLVKKWHPDKHPPSSKPEAEARFKAIAHAYEQALNGGAKGGGGGGDGGSNNGWAAPQPEPTGRRFRSDEFVPRKSHREPNDVHNTSPSPKPGFASYSSSGRKPPPVERKLECTLEELFRGCKKEICFDRDVVVNGVIVRKEETQKIKVKPGWKKGTKITFEGMGDERPGFLPADVVFLIEEKEHPFFKRVENDLMLRIEVPLRKALTGWTFSFCLISGEKMTLSFKEEIIYPGYEKVLQGHGMPMANEKSVRGDLRIKFHVRFPTKLSGEQRAKIEEALKD